MPYAIVRNDIARVAADVLVNAANERLAPGSGVCGALFAGAGYEQMLAACQKIGYCPTGSAVVTPGFNLPCRWVVHAVGPVWRGGGCHEAELLHACYRSIFAEVVRLEAQSVAYPLISAGIYSFPIDRALAIAREETEAFLDRHPDVEVTLVVFDRATIRAGGASFAELSSYIDDRYVEESPFTRFMSDGAPSERPAAAAPQAVCGAPAVAPVESASLDDLLARLDEPFSTTLLALIDARGMTDVEVYKRANISRQLFAKIRAHADYRPKKPTAVALAVALRLNLDETQDLLARAGYTLSHASKFDIIVEYFIARGDYDLFTINEALFAYDQPLLGSTS